VTCIVKGNGCTTEVGVILTIIIIIIYYYIIEEVGGTLLTIINYVLDVKSLQLPFCSEWGKALVKPTEAYRGTGAYGNVLPA